MSKDLDDIVQETMKSMAAEEKQLLQQHIRKMVDDLLTVAANGELDIADQGAAMAISLVVLMKTAGASKKDLVPFVKSAWANTGVEVVRDEKDGKIGVHILWNTPNVLPI